MKAVAVRPWSYRRPSVRRRVLSVVLLATLATGGYVSTNAIAHWAGFTGDIYFCESNYVHKGFSGLTRCATGLRHSYGFVSATHIDNSGTAYVRAGADAYYSGTPWFSSVSRANVARACYDGVYPNCHDQDGYWLRAWIGTDYCGCGQSGGIGHRLRGHANY